MVYVAVATHLFLLLSFLGALVLAAGNPCADRDDPGASDASPASAVATADDRTPTAD